MRPIDADALKDKLQQHHDFWVMAWGGFSKMPISDKKRVDEITNCIAEVVNAPTIDAVSEWIPCSERHPKDGRYYVTRIDYVTNTIFTDILWYEKGIWWNRQYTGDFAVIAWMPLPKPYEEVKENE